MNITMKDQNQIKNNGENSTEIEAKPNPTEANTSVRLRRGRKNRRMGSKVDIRAKLERSRQSARECRARKKLRYQYLEDLVIKRERANLQLKKELESFREMCKKIDLGQTPQELIKVEEEKRKNNRRA